MSPKGLVVLLLVGLCAAQVVSASERDPRSLSSLASSAKSKIKSAYSKVKGLFESGVDAVEEKLGDVLDDIVHNVFDSADNVVAFLKKIEDTAATFTNVSSTAKEPRDMLAQFGYPHERYFVRTADKYQIALDRIPNPGKQPVYLAMPVVSSAAIYLNLGPNGFGQRLYDAGYDVWLVSGRGTAYAKGREDLAESDPRNYDFTFHEHGSLDHPAAIDTVLEKTGFEKVLYVGYSMGSTDLFVMNSVRPEYNDKVAAAFLMAPVCQLAHSPNNLVQVMRAGALIAPALDALQVFPFPHPAVRVIEQALCKGEARAICNGLLLFLFNAQHYDDYVAQTYDLIQTFPGGGSLPTLWHFGQSALNPNTFRQYDRGAVKNLQIYGSATPPDYPLEKITTPVYIYRAPGDVTVVDEDYKFLQKNLKSIVKEFMSPDTTMNHADFMISLKKSQVVFNEILADMKDFLAHAV